jgi:hypothetical protein
MGDAIRFYYNNCSFRHRPRRSGAASGLDLHLPVADALPAIGGGLGDGGAGIPFAKTPIYLTAVNKAHANTLGGTYPAGTYRRIYGGKPDQSVLPARDSLRDPDGGIATGQMPNLLQRVVDQTSIDATRAWITALPP